MPENDTNALLAGRLNEGFEGMMRTGIGRISREKQLRFTEAMVLLARGKIGMEGFERRLSEHMTTSDFPILFGDMVDRTLLAGYQERVTDLSQYVQFTTVRDFNESKLLTVDGGEGENDPVAELAPYREAAVEEGEYSVRVRKYGSKFAYSFEAFVNDHLGALVNATPRRMGKKARRTEEAIITKAFATDAAIAAFFSAGNKNVILQSAFPGLALSDDNTPLSLLGLTDAYKVMAAQTDSEGYPIDVSGATVVYPAHLQPVVDNIKNALTYEFRGALGSDATQRIVTTPYLSGSINWVPNYQLARVGGTNKMTGWFMFANPSVNRPGIVAARLRGYEQPQLFMKSSDAVAIGGNGLVDAFQGDFENDGIQFKVRQFIGVSRIDPKAAVYSNGTGNS